MPGQSSDSGETAAPVKVSSSAIDRQRMVTAGPQAETLKTRRRTRESRQQTESRRRVRPFPPPSLHPLCSCDVDGVEGGDCLNQRTGAALYPRHTGFLPFFFRCSTCSPSLESQSSRVVGLSMCNMRGAWSSPADQDGDVEGMTSSSTLHLLLPLPPSPLLPFIPFFCHHTKEEEDKVLLLDLFTMDPVVTRLDSVEASSPLAWVLEGRSSAAQRQTAAVVALLVRRSAKM